MQVNENTVVKTEVNIQMLQAQKSHELLHVIILFQLSLRPDYQHLFKENPQSSLFAAFLSGCSKTETNLRPVFLFCLSWYRSRHKWIDTLRADIDVWVKRINSKKQDPRTRTAHEHSPVAVVCMQAAITCVTAALNWIISSGFSHVLDSKQKKISFVDLCSEAAS